MESTSLHPRQTGGSIGGVLPLCRTAAGEFYPPSGWGELENSKDDIDENSKVDIDDTKQENKDGNEEEMEAECDGSGCDTPWASHRSEWITDLHS